MTKEQRKQNEEDGLLELCARAVDVLSDPFAKPRVRGFFSCDKLIRINHCEDYDE